MNTAVEIFKNIIKGTVNEKKFSYDDEGLENAISYANELMRDKKPVNFEWDSSDEYVQKKWGAAEAALAGWWFGGTLEDPSRGSPTPAEQREFERQLARAERRRDRRMRKGLMEKLQKFYQNK